MTVQCDPHRRAACDQQSYNIIANNRQCHLNRAAWQERAKRHIDRNEIETAINCLKQSLID